jgi:hypothetical protein
LCKLPDYGDLTKSRRFWQDQSGTGIEPIYLRNYSSS